MLTELARAGTIIVPTGFALTPGLREWYTDEGVEELEYAASTLAARASIRLIDADPGALRRRVVVSADVPDAVVSDHDQADRGTVRLAWALPLSAVAAIHIDDAEAEVAVAAAAAVVLEADLGSEPAQDRVDDAEGFELSWYAPQELGQLVGSWEQ
jgi:hypothetical protein